MISPVKKNIIISLFFASLLLLGFYIFLNETKAVIYEQSNKELLSYEVNGIFIKSLLSFGIKEEWITENRKGKKDDSLFSYNVQVPPDLPITVLLKDLKKSFYFSDAEVTSKEMKINGKTVIEIYTQGEKKLIASADYKKNLTRNAGQAGIILNLFNSLNENEQINILAAPESFAVVLVPSEESRKIASRLPSYQKDLVVLLNDDIKEIKFRLSDNYDNARLRNSVRSIIGNFSKAAFFIVDDKSKLYHSSIFPFVRKEIERRNIAIIPKSLAAQVTGDNNEELLLNFRSGLNSQNLFLMISATDFLQLKDEIIEQRKIGFKFISPSRLL
jgi:hypothetical protein